MRFECNSSGKVRGSNQAASPGESAVSLRVCTWRGQGVPSYVRCSESYWFVIVAVVPSNFVMWIVNGSVYDLARSCKTLSATCSPRRIDQ